MTAKTPLTDKELLEYVVFAASDYERNFRNILTNPGPFSVNQRENEAAVLTSNAWYEVRQLLREAGRL